MGLKFKGEVKSRKELMLAAYRERIKEWKLRNPRLVNNKDRYGSNKEDNGVVNGNNNNRML